MDVKDLDGHRMQKGILVMNVTNKTREVQTR